MEKKVLLRCSSCGHEYHGENCWQAKDGVLHPFRQSMCPKCRIVGSPYTAEQLDAIKKGKLKPPGRK